MQEKISEKEKWEEYCKLELAKVLPILERLGFMVDEKQVHIGGERYLMSGKKLVLTGRRKSDDEKVIIKVSSDKDGIKEIKEEHERIGVLNKLDFSYFKFLLPKEILFKNVGKYIISVNLYIKEDVSFLFLNTESQFLALLKSFKTQEGLHALAHSHNKSIEKVFGAKKYDFYIKEFKKFVRLCADYKENSKLQSLVQKAESFLTENRETLERYSNFLTHDDFVPHNFRINGGDIYLLDCASLFFGNKYDSWARLSNYMLLYNKELEGYIVKYIKENRCEEEYLSFRLMRVFRLGFLLSFYVESLEKTKGDLSALNKKRINFWLAVLECILENKEVSESLILDYKKTRDSLRDEAEKERQKKLGQL